MVRIFIVTFGGIKRDSGGILFGKPDFRGPFVRVNLNRERLGGAQHFKQERQFTKTLGNFGAKQGRFIAVDCIAQRTRRSGVIENLRASLSRP